MRIKKIFILLVCAFCVTPTRLIENIDDFEEPDFGNLIRNAFSKLFTSWPFDFFDGTDYLAASEIDNRLNESQDSKMNKSMSSQVKWVPIDFTDLCNNTNRNSTICGKNTIDFKKICKHIERGATVKGFCKNGNTPEDSFLRITINYIDPVRNTTNQTIRNRPTSLKLRRYSNNETQRLNKKNKTTNLYFNSKYDKSKIDDDYGWGMYGVAMSSGALGTVLIILLIVITYSIVRVGRIKVFQARLDKANDEGQRGKPSTYLAAKMYSK
ncbi:hypothetical protein MXB_57, partial [Myxobolus squamalis]